MPAVDDRGTPERPGYVELSLRDRIPEYLAVFGVGLGAAAVLGGLIGIFSDAAFSDAVGYSLIALGVLFLLTGGASGGGYANMGLGAVTRLLGGREPDEETQDPDVRRGAKPRIAPSERLRRGLRPEANPRAFWQVIGGLAYVAIGVMVVQYIN